MKSFLRQSTPAILTLIACILAYGLWIPWLGLYADDWPFIYVNHIAGPAGVVEFISWVRPVAAWFFAFAAGLTGEHFWVAHALLLVLRWFVALAFYYLLRDTFPNARNLALWSALFLAVYPAFKQQPLAVEYVPHFLALGILFASLRFSVFAASEKPLTASKRLIYHLLAWVGSWQVFILEYFSGLELMRPILLYVIYKRRMSHLEAFRRATITWLPFLFVLAGFVLWRVFILGFPSYQPELLSELSESHLKTLAGLSGTISNDLWTAGILAWVQPFVDFPVGGRTLLLWAGIVTTSFAIFGILIFGFEETQHLWHRVTGLKRYSNPSCPAELGSGVDLRHSLFFISLGLFAMLAAGPPFWVTRIPLSLDFPWDRTTLAFMTGASLFAAGLLGLLQNGLARIRLRPGSVQVLPRLLLCALLAFSIGLHFQNANKFRKEWTILRDFAWQLSWRAPGLAPGSAVLLDQSPFNYHVDKFLSPLLNWIYAPDNKSLELSYSVLDFHKQWGKTLPPQTPKDPIQVNYGTLSFTGRADQLLIAVYDPPGCFRLLTPAESTHLIISEELKETLSLQNLTLIQPRPPIHAQPPDFLGPEPAHNWCYYYQQAALALQQGSPQDAVEFYETATEKGFSAGQPSEYLLYVDAYTQTGQWEKALQISHLVVDSGDFYKNAACTFWDHIRGKVDAQEGANALLALDCERNHR